MTDPISTADRDALLANGWTATEGRDAIHKTFVFKNFVEAFGFINWPQKWTRLPQAPDHPCCWVCAC